jgi:galactokinase
VLEGTRKNVATTRFLCKERTTMCNPASGRAQPARWAAEACFSRVFGGSPEWVSRAPGRVNLIGEHTDYNAGFVLPMALDRYVTIAAARSTEASGIRIHSDLLHATESVDLGTPQRPVKGSWTNYLRGIFEGFQRLGHTLVPLDMVVCSEVPLGGGLSSSAALEVATATLLEAVFETHLEPTQKALLCQRAEHEFAGVPCGLMDQLASVYGKKGAALLIDCQSNAVQPVPLENPEVCVLVANSNVRHSLGDGAYALRREQCEKAAVGLGVSTLRAVDPARLEAGRSALEDLVYRRARHVVTENERTQRFSLALGSGQLSEAGQLMYRSHASLRDDYEVSCRELDVLVDLAQGIGESGGVFGSRMTGGGFGGCTVSLVARAAVPAIMKTLTDQYQSHTGRVLDVFVTQPSQGCHLLPASLGPSQDC